MFLNKIKTAFKTKKEQENAIRNKNNKDKSRKT